MTITQRQHAQLKVLMAQSRKHNRALDSILSQTQGILRDLDSDAVSDLVFSDAALDLHLSDLNIQVVPDATRGAKIREWFRRLWQR